MIIGILSLVLDTFILNITNYCVNNTIIFPMFSLVFLLSLIYYNYDIKVIAFFLILYSCINGILYLPLLICILSLLNKKEKSLNNYLLLMTFYLITYDLLFYLLLSVSDYKLLIDKIVVSLPINVLYSYFLFNVLNNKKKSIN